MKEMIENKARAIKDRPVSIRIASDVLEGVGDACDEEVAPADWLERPGVCWPFKLGDPVVNAICEVRVPDADPVGPPLELMSEIDVPDPGASALVLLGEVDNEFDREFGPPVEGAVAGDETEEVNFSASPVV
jgi:hypothetical protein